MRGYNASIDSPESVNIVVQYAIDRPESVNIVVQ